jgi:small conductance mechanosensitive channel
MSGTRYGKRKICMLIKLTQVIVFTVCIGMAAVMAPMNSHASEEKLPESADSSTESEQSLILGQALIEIKNRKRAIEDLEARISKASGLTQKALESRLIKHRMSLLEQNLSFAKTVADQVDGDTNIDKYRKQAIEVISAQLEVAKTTAAIIRTRIVLPEEVLPAAEQAANYSRVFEMLDTLNRVYNIFLESLVVSRVFELDVATQETLLKESLLERAANGSILLDMTLGDVKALRASAAAVPDDAEIKAKLNVAVTHVSRLASGLTAILAMMEILGMDTTAYQQQLLGATGQITTDVFEVGVFTNLLVGWSQTLWNVLIDSGPGLFFKLILFFVIVFAFRKLANLAQKLTESGFANSEVELSLLLQRMVIMIVGNTITVIGVLIALAQVGISLGPLLAGLGLVGFVVGFALQDTLSNFAAGLLILIYRPFDVDDFVEAGGVSGMVSNMSLVNTTILTFDNQTIVVPNNKIWGDVIKNVTAQANRRIDMVFGISYTDDVLKTEKLLKEIVDSHEAVLVDPEPIIRLHELADSSVNFIVRPWVTKEDYWETYWDITRSVKLRFDEEGISIPFPQRDVHLYNT